MSGGRVGDLDGDFEFAVLPRTVESCALTVLVNWSIEWLPGIRCRLTVLSRWSA